MSRERVVHAGPQPVTISRWVGIHLSALAGRRSDLHASNLAQCIDGCGPYHNTTSVADLDGDGDLDVVLNNLRHETGTIIWAGAMLWINQGGGCLPNGVWI